MRGLELLSFFAMILMIAPLGAGAAERATESFRKEHAEVKQHLGHIETMVGKLPAANAAEQKKTADFVVKFFEEHIKPHAEWEEQHLYPAVDKRTHEGEHRFTSTMRYEHTIVGRSIDELKTLAAKSEIDATSFARKTDRLLGLLMAHFEEEEEVLLPILDKSSTKESLEKELGMEQRHEHKS